MNSDNLRTSRLCAFVANKSSAFRTGFRRGLMPQKKFCGYENSAFQAKNTLEYRNIHRSRSFQFTGSLLPERQ
ncbi:hypothetical protein C0T31_07715 [Dysgonamonadaceae bacterium]|nr:hypothetical protein C0T31_07715 [Dysgonamonadaceae bacterium]